MSNSLEREVGVSRGISKQRGKGTLGRIASGALLLAVVVLVMAPNLVSPLPDRDAGVFLYAGSRILEGEVPYRDFWDHKGPLIFYINALGLLISPRSELGIWLLEAFSLAAGAAAGYGALRSEFGRVPAILGTASWISGLAILLRPGNYTEEFALPFLFGSLLVVGRFRDSPRQAGWLAALGVNFACCLLLRPNNVGTAAAAAIVILAERLAAGDARGFVTRLVPLAAGAVAVLGPTVAYFGTQGALPHLWDALFRYNSAYVVRSIKASLDAVIEGLTLLSPSGLTLLGVAGWLWMALTLLFQKPRPARSLLAWTGLVGLPIDLAVVGVAGRSLNHYFILWLPTLSVLMASFLAGMAEQARPRPDIPLGSARWIAASLFLAILIFPARRLLPPASNLIREGPRQRAAPAEVLGRRSEQYLLMWGAEAFMNFQSGKPSPTRFVYQYPLYTCGYVTEEMVEELAAAICDRLPLIVDTSPTNQQVPPIDPVARAQWETADEACALTPAMDRLLRYLEASYRAEGQLEGTAWLIYTPVH